MWMLLHPLHNSKLYSRLQETSSEGLAGKGVDADPLRLHLLIFSSYIDNWRMYLHDMTRQFSELVSVNAFHDTIDYYAEALNRKII